MCGRYQFSDGENAEIESLIARVKEAFPEKAFQSISFGEVFPGSAALALAYDPNSQKMKAVAMKWGFGGTRLVINARSETCFERPFFKDCRPCVLPASGYYEWSKNPHVKYLFTAAEKTMYLCGLYRRENEKLTFVILTQDAEEPQNLIHTRQPVLIARENVLSWAMKKDRSLVLQHSGPRFMTEV
jgi:putative SOS response-associated peptidase YedK